MSFEGFDPLTFGSDVFNDIVPKKKKQKGTFDEIFDFAGIGGNPFIGFSKPEKLDDFAIPVKRKRRSKEAVFLGIREDPEDPILGLQFFGNAVGFSEAFLGSEKIQKKFRADKKSLQELGKFKTDEQGNVLKDAAGKPIKSKLPEDAVIFGRTLNPKIKSFIAKQRTKSRLKSTTRKSIFGTASPSSLITPTNDEDVFTREGIRVKGQKRERLPFRSEEQGGNIFSQSEKQIDLSPSGEQAQIRIEKSKKKPTKKPNIRGFFGTITEEEQERLDVGNKLNKQRLRETVASVLNRPPTVLREVKQSKPVESLQRRPLVIADGKKFQLEEREDDDMEETAGGRLLSSLEGITERIESEPIRPFSESGKQIDLSPAGEQSQIRIAKSRRKPTEEPDVTGFFAAQEQETRKPVTFADAEEDGAESADEGMQKFTQSDKDSEGMSDFIFRGGQPISLEEETDLIQKRKESGFSGEGFGISKMSEAEKDRAGKIDDFGDIVEKARDAKDVGLGISDLGTTSSDLITSEAVGQDIQPEKESPTSFNTTEAKDGIRPDIDRRSGLSGGLRNLSLIDKIEKRGTVNSPKMEITEDQNSREMFLDKVAEGVITEEGIQEELEILNDPDIPKSTRTRKRRKLKDALNVLKNFKGGAPTPRADQEIDPQLQVSDLAKQSFEEKMQSAEEDKRRNPALANIKETEAKQQLKKQAFRESGIVPVEDLKSSTERTRLTELTDDSDTEKFDSGVLVEVDDDKNEGKKLRTKIVTKGKKLFELAKKAREKGTTIEEEAEEESELEEKAEKLSEKEIRETERALKVAEKKREKQRFLDSIRKRKETDDDFK